MINEDLRRYDFIEAAAFEGIMPKVAEKIGVAGSKNQAKEFGFDATGVDQLEVVDFAKVFEAEKAEGGEDTPPSKEESTTE